jgi:hypothetical protein
VKPEELLFELPPVAQLVIKGQGNVRALQGFNPFGAEGYAIVVPGVSPRVNVISPFQGSFDNNNHKTNDFLFHNGAKSKSSKAPTT